MSFFTNEIEFGDKIGLAEKLAVKHYINKLSSQGLPELLSPEHLSHITNVRIESLYAMSNSSCDFYRSFFIPKRSGGRRKIDAPLPSLCYVQRWILDEILVNIKLHPSAKAYRKGYSTFENAKFHRAQNVVFKLDVKDFFGSIKEQCIFNIFKSIGYTKRLSKLLSKLSTLEGCLPQGAPTSGCLSNIYMIPFDRVIFDYCKNNSIRYTRYADDLTFSGKDIDIKEVKKNVEKQLNSIDLNLNYKKIRELKPHVRQEVTGACCQ